MDLVDNLLATPRNGDAAAADGHDEMDDDSLQVRTMEVPRWLSTPEVTSKLLSLLFSLVEMPHVCFGV